MRVRGWKEMESQMIFPPTLRVTSGSRAVVNGQINCYWLSDYYYYYYYCSLSGMWHHWQPQFASIGQVHLGGPPDKIQCLYYLLRRQRMDVERRVAE